MKSATLPIVEAPPLVALPSIRRSDGRTLAYASFAVICLIWGTTFVAIRVAIQTIPTLLVTGLRFLLAGIVLLAIARLRGVSFQRPWRRQIISGILMAAFGNALVVYAEHTLSSGLAALLAATIPIWMALLEWFSGSGRLTPRKVAGLTLGFTGVGILVAPAIGHLDASMPFFIAVGAMQLSSICWNAGTLYSRRGPAGDPLANSVIQMLSAGIVVTSAAFAIGNRPTAAMFSLRSTAALLYLALFGSVIAYSAYNYAISRLSAGKVSSYAYVNPAVAVLTGVLLLGEPVTPQMIAAMIVILAGVALIQLDRRLVVVREKA